MSLVPRREAFSTVKWWAVPFYPVTLVALHYFRAVRWRFLLRSFADLPRRRILAVSWIGFAAILILPLRIGEFVRPYMIRDKGKLSMSAATGTIVAERIVDGLFVSGVLAAALLWVPTLHPLPEKVVGLPSVSVSTVRASGFIVLYVFLIAFATIAVYYFARSWARRATLFVFGLVSKKLAEKLADTASKLADGLGFLGRPRDALPFLVETFLYWGLNAFGMWILAWACGVEHADGTPINFAEACALMGMLGATILIPGPPGLLGLFHVGIYCGMTFYFSPKVIEGPGSVYVFLLYIIQLIWTLACAGYFLRDPKAREELREAEHDVEVGAAEPEAPKAAEAP